MDILRTWCICFLSMIDSSIKDCAIRLSGTQMSDILVNTWPRCLYRWLGSNVRLCEVRACSTAVMSCKLTCTDNQMVHHYCLCNSLRNRVHTSSQHASQLICHQDLKKGECWCHVKYACTFSGLRTSQVYQYQKEHCHILTPCALSSIVNRELQQNKWKSHAWESPTGHKCKNWIYRLSVVAFRKLECLMQRNL